MPPLAPQYFDISQIPTTHDSLAWAASHLGVRVNRGDLPAPFFINSDAAFSLTESMIVPSGASEHDNFDYFQSAMRMPIECAFGILVQRWGILWKPLAVRFDRRAALIAACIRLHNLCIDERIQEETGVPQGVDAREMAEVQPGRWDLAPLLDRDGRPVEHLNIERGERPRARDRRKVKSARRDALVRAVFMSGLTRPPLRGGLIKKVKKPKGGGKRAKAKKLPKLKPKPKGIGGRPR